MIPESSKKKQQTKRPSKTEESKHWSLSGEILVVSDKKPPVRSQIKAFSTFHLTMDQNGQMFSPASLEVDFNGKREIVTLSSHQVKLILNVLGYVKHVKVD